MLRRAIPVAAASLALAAPAAATVGVSHGVHPLAVGSPTTVHAGPLYYKPGNGHRDHRMRAAAGYADTDLYAFVHPRQAAARRRCRVQHFEYAMRHGVTTPTPLKGFHGCAKYALDAAYWRHRRNEPSLKVQTDPLAATAEAVTLGVHNLILPW